ncbi:ATP-binding protein [Paenibacillus pinihumi]|uniref:ATP-binding protein n=1 Tax=Paenibacillus pinihumi TaxID=669462 RepID=UPI0004246563|nr:ATP-binding protein [Paenibacillus pinihumi]
MIGNRNVNFVQICSGIGLTIVKRLTEAHGGSVRIESHDGTTIYIRLPNNNPHLN